MPATKQTNTPAPKTEFRTLRISRVIKAPAERIYNAFLDPDALAKWLPPHGFTGHVHEMSAKVGGKYRMSFSTINRSWTQFFGGKYLELKPYEKIVHTDAFEGDVPGWPKGHTMTVTILLKPVKGGTEVQIEQGPLPKGSPASEGAPEGWGQSLDNLQRLCEAELPF